MKQKATGTFDVQLTPQPATDGLTRLAIAKQFHGDLEATSAGEMLSAMTGVEGSAAYVALEWVSGALHGRRGAFALHHTGVMARGAPSLSVRVVPDSGRDELTGLAGQMTIRVEGDAHYYDFDFALDEGHAASAPDEPADEETGTSIPALPCTSLEETLPFYEALGFTVTYRQKSPSIYGIVRRGNYELHFYGLKGLDPQTAFSTCVVIVPDVERLHAVFAEGLRAALGKLPTKGLPRITRMRPGQSRFTVVDPSGNSVIFVREGPEDEDAAEAYKQPDQTPMQKALNTAVRLRDFKNDDKAAAKVLDSALARHLDAAPVERARTIAARVELAVVLGETYRVAVYNAELQNVVATLSDAERESLRTELQLAAEAMVRQS